MAKNKIVNNICVKQITKKGGHMKKRIVPILVATLFALLSLGCSGMSGMPGGLDKSGGGTAGGSKVDIDAIDKQSAKIVIKVVLANIAFAKSSADILEAVGKSESAEKLRATVANIKDNPNKKEGLKTLVDSVNNAQSELNKIDLTSSLELSKARLFLGKSILEFGAGVILDLSSANDAKKLLTDAKDAIQQVKAAPMQYGPSALKSLNEIFEVSKFIAESIPSQATNIQTFTTKLIDYAKTNKIELPSQSEIEKRSMDMEKE